MRVWLGQSADFTGFRAEESAQLRYGMLAALHEENLAAGPTEPKIGLVSLDDAGGEDLMLVNARALLERPVAALVGFVAMNNGQDVLVMAAQQQAPFIGPYNGQGGTLRDFQASNGMARYAIHYRSSVWEEAAAIVNWIWANEFVRAGILYDIGQGAILEYAPRFQNSIASKSMRLLFELPFNASVVGNATSLDEVIDHLGLQATDVTDMLLIKGSPGPTAKVIQALRQLFGAGTRLVVASDMSVVELSSYLTESKDRHRVYSMQQVPRPNGGAESSIEVVRKAALALEALGESLNVTIPLEHVSLEGYIIGRLVAAVVKRVWPGLPPITTAPTSGTGYLELRNAFLDHIYDSGVVEFSGLRLGPYGDHRCLGSDGQPPDSWCPCNQGTHEVYALQLSNSSECRATGYRSLDECFSDFSDIGIQYSGCIYEYNLMRFRWGVTAPSEDHKIFAYFRQGLQMAFGRTSLENVVELIVRYDGGDPEKAAENAENLLLGEGAFGILGTFGDRSSLAVKKRAADKHLFVGAQSGHHDLRWPMRPNVINVRASYVDEAAAIVDLFLENLGLSRISVFTQVELYGSEGLFAVNLSLRAHGLKVYSFVDIDGQALNGSFADAAFHMGILNGSQGRASSDCPGCPDTDKLEDPQAIIIFAEPQLLNVVVSVAARWSQISRDEIRVATVSTYVDELEEWGRFELPLLITLVTPPYYDTGLPLPTLYREAMRADNSDEPYSHASFEGFVVGLMIIDIVALVPVPAVTMFRDYVFFRQTISLEGESLGPYLLPDSSPPGCSSGFRKVWREVLPSDGSGPHGLGREPQGQSGGKGKGKGVASVGENLQEYAFADACPTCACNMAQRPCTLNYYRENPDDICKPCDVGYKLTYSNSEATGCKQCPEGTFGMRVDQGLQCLPCVTGMFTDKAGETECSRCPPGKYTLKDTGNSECTECPIGRFSATQASKSCDKCPPPMFGYKAGEDICTDVPENAAPKKEAGLNVGYVADPGYYLFEVEPRDLHFDRPLHLRDPYPLGHIYRCPHESITDGVSACAGENNCSMSISQEVIHANGGDACADAPCEPAQEGLYCGICRDGFARGPDVEGACQRCPSDITAIAYQCLAIFRILAVVLFLYFSVKLFRDVSKPRNVLSIVFKQLLNYVTMADVVFDIIDINYPFGGFHSSGVKGTLTNTFGVSSTSNLDIASECLLKRLTRGWAEPYQAEMLQGVLWVPVWLSFITILAFPVLWCFARHNHARLRSNLLTFVIANLYVSHPYITKKLLRGLTCVQVDKPRLVADLRVECSLSDETYVTWMLVGIGGLIVFSFGIPLLFAVCLWRQHLKRTLWTDETRNTAGLLFDGFERPVYWFESWLMIRKVLFNILNDFITVDGPADTQTELDRSLRLIILCIVSFAVHMMYRPYDNRTYFLLDRMEERLLAAMLVTLVLILIQLASTSIAQTMDLTFLRWVNFFVILFFHGRFFVTMILGTLDTRVLLGYRGPCFARQSHPIRIRTNSLALTTKMDHTSSELFASVIGDLVSMQLKESRGEIHYGRLAHDVRKIAHRAFTAKLLQHMANFNSWPVQAAQFWSHSPLRLCMPRPPRNLLSCLDWVQAKARLLDEVKNSMDETLARESFQMTYTEINKLRDREYWMSFGREAFLYSIGHHILLVDLYDALVSLTMQGMMKQHDADPSIQGMANYRERQVLQLVPLDRLNKPPPPSIFSGSPSDRETRSPAGRSPVGSPTAAGGMAAALTPRQRLGQLAEEEEEPPSYTQPSISGRPRRNVRANLWVNNCIDALDSYQELGQRIEQRLKGSKTPSKS